MEIYGYYLLARPCLAGSHSNTHGGLSTFGGSARHLVIPNHAGSMRRPPQPTRDETGTINRVTWAWPGPLHRKA